MLHAWPAESLTSGPRSRAELALDQHTVSKQLPRARQHLRIFLKLGRPSDLFVQEPVSCRKQIEKGTMLFKLHRDHAVLFLVITL